MRSGRVGGTIIPGAGTAAGAVIGGSAGVTTSIYSSTTQESRLERGPVHRLYQASATSDKIAENEQREAARLDPSIGARPSLNIFSVTRQIGIFFAPAVCVTARYHKFWRACL
jgi:hypothetical protein